MHSAQRRCWATLSRTYLALLGSNKIFDKFQKYILVVSFPQVKNEERIVKTFMPFAKCILLILTEQVQCEAISFVTFKTTRDQRESALRIMGRELKAVQIKSEFFESTIARRLTRMIYQISHVKFSQGLTRYLSIGNIIYSASEKSASPFLNYRHLS